MLQKKSRKIHFLVLGIALTQSPPASYLRPGTAVPHASGHAGTSVAGLHLRRFVPDAVPASFALPDASSCQTHHLPLLHPRATLRRTLRGKVEDRVRVYCRGRGAVRAFSFWWMHVTHSLGPVGEVPVGHAWPHVAFLAPLWPNPGTALLVVDNAALVGDAADVPRPPAQSAVHRALEFVFLKKGTLNGFTFSLSVCSPLCSGT